MNAHVSQSGWPALVLNADFRPLSYYPLSLWSWQDAIKAVFLDRVNIVAELRPRSAQPFVRDAAAERRVAEVVRQADHAPGVHAVQRLPARQVRLPVLRRRCRPDLRPHRPALARRPHDLGERRRRLLALQSAQGQHDAAGGAHVPVAATLPAHGPSAASKRPASSRPNYLHDSWMDYLYWDTELDP